MDNNQKPSSLRLKIVQVSPEIILSMMIEGADIHMRVMENGLPPDAKVSGCCYDPQARVFCIKVESESFPELFEGDKIPICKPPVFVNSLLEISTPGGVF